MFISLISNLKYDAKKECRTKAPEDRSPLVKKCQGGQKALDEFYN